MAECVTSIDCFDPTTGVQKQCYESSPSTRETFFCECALNAHWVGENCDQVSPAIRFNRGLHFIFVAWMLLLLIITGRSVVFSLMLETDWLILKKLSFQAIVFVFLSVLTFLLYFFFFMPFLFDPRNVKVYPAQDYLLGEGKELLLSRNRKSHELLLTFSICFFQTAFYLILHKLTEVIVFTAKFEGLKSAKVALFWEKVLRFLHFNLYLLFFLLAALYKAEFTGFAFLIFGVYLFVTFGFCGFLTIRFAYLLEKVPGNGRNLAKVVTLVKRVGLVLVSSGILNAVVAIYFGVFRGAAEEKDVVGDLNWTVLSSAVTKICHAINITAVAWYLDSTSESTIIADFYPRWCWMFDWWDRENKVIFPEEQQETELV